MWFYRNLSKQLAFISFFIVTLPLSTNVIADEGTVEVQNESKDSSMSSWEKLGAPPPAKVQKSKADVVVDYGTDSAGNPMQAEYVRDPLTNTLLRINTPNSSEPHNGH